MVDNADSESKAARERTRSAWKIIILVLVVSLLLGGGLFYNYSRFLSYVHDTLNAEDRESPWLEESLTPEECVDASMTWAAECVGIKALCDEYVTRVTQECMENGTNREYCIALGDRTASTELGAEECVARGTERHIDAESCANAYRAIDAYCTFVRDQIALEEGGDLSPRGIELLEERGLMP